MKKKEPKINYKNKKFQFNFTNSPSPSHSISKLVTSDSFDHCRYVFE